ncbi:cingulin-like [Sinocyclocheilus rhinocerous]|uniref:cingulin-like n=1 Tax=Sinocyclocheilus rhinocerous TaxID=307959 RepID=UPI0007BA8659|nr:PREDICTED: cingulin-like [Sinocyclocheilus rhinocerous]
MCFFKQLKLAQEKIIDLEGDLEELQENEQRWASKHKRAVDQVRNHQKPLMTQRIRSLKRQLNEAEEEASRRDVQHRHTHRELMEERETNSRLQRQLLDQQLHNKCVSHTCTHAHTLTHSLTHSHTHFC